MEEIFLGVMDLQEAKNHQLALKGKGIDISFKTNGETCTTGCKVTVEVWGKEADSSKLHEHFHSDYLKHVKGHEPNFEHLSAIFDPAATEVTCQACGTKFAPTATECPDCGLCY
jgi:ribosomal protein S27E